MEVDQFPDDVIADIFVRLPVKSLLRFKCLSKSFFALIDSFRFINMHLTRSSQAFNLRKIVFQDSWNKKFHVCDVDLNSEDEVLPLGKPVSSPMKQVYGYCKGLILLHRPTPYRKPSHSLWNPSTRQFKDVPAFISLFPSYPHFQTIVGSGLGYDESRDEFKAVYLVEIEENGKTEHQFWVYGLKSEFGRTVKFPYLINFVARNLQYSNGIGQFAEGSLHWLINDSTDSQTEIVAFDVSKETFSFVPQPACNDDLMARLHTLGESLCISYWDSDPLPHAELFVRNKNGSGGFSWSLIYSVREPLLLNWLWFDSVDVLGYMEGGDKILLDFGMSYLVSYDLESKSFERVKLKKKKKNWETPILCEESLASVDGVL